MSEISIKMLVALIQLISLNWITTSGKFYGCFCCKFVKILTNTLRECFAGVKTALCIVRKFKASLVC